MNQVLGDILLYPAERLLNGLLARDRHLADVLREFHGKALSVDCSQPPVQFTVAFSDSEIRLIAGDGNSAGYLPDASVRGKAIDLLSMLLRHENSQAVQIHGDAEFLLDLQHRLQSLDIRWDDYLAPIFGDVLTEQLHRAGRDFGQWGEQAGNNIKRSVQDYIHEEARLVTGRREAERFNRELANLKMAIDRSEARLRRMETQVQAD